MAEMSALVRERRSHRQTVRCALLGLLAELPRPFARLCRHKLIIEDRYGICVEVVTGIEALLLGEQFISGRLYECPASIGIGLIHSQVGVRLILRRFDILRIFYPAPWIRNYCFAKGPKTLQETPRLLTDLRTSDDLELAKRRGNDPVEIRNCVERFDLFPEPGSARNPTELMTGYVAFAKVPSINVCSLFA
jgi:hypothetical protein